MIRNSALAIAAIICFAGAAPSYGEFSVQQVGDVVSWSTVAPDNNPPEDRFGGAGGQSQFLASLAIPLVIESDSPFDFVVAQIRYGNASVSFDSSAHFFAQGWSGLMGVQDDQAASLGPVTSQLNTSLIVSRGLGKPVGAIEIDVAAFAGNELVGSATGEGYEAGVGIGLMPDWPIQTVKFSGGRWHPDRQAFQNPTPGAALLGAIGLIIVMCLRRHA